MQTRVQQKKKKKDAAEISPVHDRARIMRVGRQGRGENPVSQEDDRQRTNPRALFPRLPCPTDCANTRSTCIRCSIRPVVYFSIFCHCRQKFVVVVVVVDRCNGCNLCVSLSLTVSVRTKSTAEIIITLRLQQQLLHQLGCSYA